jgi:hypothetical protein
MKPKLMVEQRGRGQLRLVVSGEAVLNGIAGGRTA